MIKGHVILLPINLLRPDRTDELSFRGQPHQIHLSTVAQHGRRQAIINKGSQCFKQLPISCQTVGGTSKPALMSPGVLRKEH